MSCWFRDLLGGMRGKVFGEGFGCFKFPQVSRIGSNNVIPRSRAEMVVLPAMSSVSYSQHCRSSTSMLGEELNPFPLGWPEKSSDNAALRLGRAHTVQNDPEHP